MDVAATDFIVGIKISTYFQTRLQQYIYTVFHVMIKAKKEDNFDFV